MTREEMDRAAHQLLLQERRGQPLSYQLQQDAEQPAWGGRPTTTGIGYQPLQEQPPTGDGQSSVYQPQGSYHQHQHQQHHQHHRGSDRQQQQQREPPS